MKLEINDLGSWRRVIFFHVSEEALVKKDAEALAKLSRKGPRLRISDDLGLVTAHWDRATGWKVPSWRDLI